MIIEYTNSANGDNEIRNISQKHAVQHLKNTSLPISELVERHGNLDVKM